MNAAIVDNINAVVKQDDILFHLGDWSFGGSAAILEFRNRIVCKNIHLIYGNHDMTIKNSPGYQQAFSSVQDYLELDVRMYTGEKQHKLVFQQDFILMHFPISSWNKMNKGSIHLHGHVHFSPVKRIGKGKLIDVGVDGNNLKPVSILEVMQLMSKQPISSNLPFDHHIKDLENGGVR
jgi:calcineurin-like phosphoesterase family protein